MTHSSKSILKDEIRWLLEAISEQFEAIHEYEEKIPQIEFDIIMENIRKLYEDLHRLNRIGEPVHTVSDPPVVRPVIPSKPEPVAERIPVERPGPKPAVKITVETAGSEPHKKESRKPETTSGDMDLFSAEGGSFQEKLKETREKSYAAERQSSKKTDLKASISINDKFLFLNELFDGNLREYNITVETLNGFADLRQALEFLDVERMKNRWESEAPAFKRLKDLLEKKF